MATTANKATRRVYPRGRGAPADHVGLLRRVREAFYRVWYYREIVCHAVAVVFSIGIVFPTMVLLFDRREVLAVSNPTIVPSPVVLGREMRLTWDATEYRNCEGEVQRVIIDSSNRIFYFAKQNTAYHDASDAATKKFSTTPIVVPNGLHVEEGETEGEATYVSYISRWCNLPQKWFWRMTEPPRRVKFRFMVDPSSPPQGRRGDAIAPPAPPPLQAPPVLAPSLEAQAPRLATRKLVLVPNWTSEIGAGDTPCAARPHFGSQAACP